MTEKSAAADSRKMPAQRAVCVASIKGQSSGLSPHYSDETLPLPASLPGWSTSGAPGASATATSEPLSKATCSTTPMLYWATSSCPTSARYYYEGANQPWQPSHDRLPVVETPTAIAVFPVESSIRSAPLG
jgi:hypothetical protein